MNKENKDNETSVISLQDIKEIELRVLARSRELISGNHASIFRGSGDEIAGLRDFEPGDRPNSVDWSQSSINSFSPMVVKDFEEFKIMDVVAVADRSLSTRFCINGISVAHIIARAMATIGVSALFFRDPFGSVVFDENFFLQSFRPEAGRSKLWRCLNSYQKPLLSIGGDGKDNLTRSVRGILSRKSLVVLISDFLFDDAEKILADFRRIKSIHDVFVVLADSSFSLHLPNLKSGWIEVSDAETGRIITVSSRELRKFKSMAEERQLKIGQEIKKLGIGVVRASADKQRSDMELVNFFFMRRLAKIRS